MCTSGGIETSSGRPPLAYLHAHLHAHLPAHLPPHHSGNPMIFVNRDFCFVTGYTKDEANGLNCRFLQGPKTEPAAVAHIQAY